MDLARLQIRPPEDADLAAMAELSGQLGYASTADQIQARIENMRSSPDFAVFVADAALEAICGWIGVYIFRAVEVDPVAVISGLVVRGEVRSHGIGARLIARAEAWARTRGCAAISVRANVTRERAHAFYQRQGFAWHKRQETFQKPL